MSFYPRLSMALIIACAAHVFFPRVVSPQSCADEEAFHVLDFWVGEWDVFVEEQQVGTNHIEKILGGCAILEHWTDTRGAQGKSLFYYVSTTADWKQVWVTENALRPGGVKEKRLVERLPEGGFRFQGEIPLPEGGHYLDRTTLGPLPDGTVRQVIERSNDGGATWEVAFDGLYRRRGETGSASSTDPNVEPPGAPPAARRGERVDTYHGTTVPDPYRWLEDMDAPESLGWVHAQDDHTRRLVASPTREKLREDIARIAQVHRYTAPLKQGGRHFFLRFPASGPGPGTALLMREESDGPDHVLIDPASLPEGAGLVRIAPDPDGNRVAYLVTSAGSAWGELRFLDVDSGEPLADILTGVQAGLSSFAWSEDGSGVFYERFDVPEEGEERSARIEGEWIAFHRIGEPQASDEVLFARPDQPGWSLTHAITADGRYLVIAATDGSTQHTRVFYLDLAVAGADAVELIGEDDAAYRFVGNRNDTLWFWTDLDAPRGRIIAVDLAAPERSEWRELVPEADMTISSWIGATAIGDRILVGYLKDARTVVRIFDVSGRFLTELDPPREGSLWSGFAGTQEEPIALYSLSGLIDPGTIYRLDVRTGESEVFVEPEVGYDPADFVTEQVFYEGRDGTLIPMFLVHAKGLEPDLPRPVFMYGYGFGAWSAAPWFQAHMAVWLQQGGIWALPNIRGGGEYGEAWHEAGSRRRKQTAIDDYIDAAEWLIVNGWTSSRLLVANGSSAGGSVVGAALVQRPDLFGAVILDYPVLDMLRYDRFTGAQRWRSEYGSVEDPEDFRALLTYSPYHNVEPGVCYPSTLVAPGERDEVTPPLHAYKFVAALQHAQACDEPILLRVSWGAGHSAGATLEDSIDTWADQLAFLMTALPESGLAPARLGINPHATKVPSSFK